MIKVDDFAGGGKVIQCDLFIAAINHLNISEFLEEFYQIEWEAPEYIRLMLKDEQEERFSIYVPKM